MKKIFYVFLILFACDGGSKGPIGNIVQSPRIINASLDRSVYSVTGLGILRLTVRDDQRDVSRLIVKIYLKPNLSTPIRVGVFNLSRQSQNPMEYESAVRMLWPLGRRHTKLIVKDIKGNSSDPFILKYEVR